MMGLKTIAKWVYLIGLVVAILAALFGFSADWLTWLLMLAAVFAGLFYANTDDVVGFSVRYLALAVVAASLDSFPAIGEYITTIVNAAVMFLGPALLAALVMWFIKKTTAE